MQTPQQINEIISLQLQKIPSYFSNAWIFEFNNLIDFLQKNSLTDKIIKEIEKIKAEDFEILFKNLILFQQDVTKCLGQILKDLKKNPKLLKLCKPNIDNILNIKLNNLNATTPIFEIRQIFFDYYNKIKEIALKIGEDESCLFIAKHFILSYFKLHDEIHINVEFTFSKNLYNCERELEIFLGKNSSRIWGKWDLVLQWQDRIRNGLSNEYLEQNLRNLFNKNRTGEMIQGVGIYFLEKLTNMQKLLSNTQSLEAIELFLDNKNQYWIIIHDREDKKPFFIKKIQTKSKSHQLLAVLFNSEPNSPITFSRLSHALGELKIKNELKKVFFPFGTFIGIYVHQSNFNEPIDRELILETLSSIQSRKKNIPSFDWGNYHSNRKTY